MTDEQIKQNAEEYADSIYDRKFQNSLWKDKYYAFVAGAHSRDEEIKELEKRVKYADESIADADKWIAKYKLELDKLRNPWISVSDKMPEEFEVVIAYAANGHIENSYWDGHYWTGDFYDTTVIYWMPLPKLKKGE